MTQYGFKKQKSTGTVNTEKVFSGGKHFIGPDFEFKKFKASSHFLDLIDVTVFTADKLEVSQSSPLTVLLFDNDDLTSSLLKERKNIKKYLVPTYRKLLFCIYMTLLINTVKH